MIKELVVAYYNQDISWTSELSDDISVKIYRKGTIPYLESDIVLPNIGREIHTYFYHIIKNYQNLADYTFFAQDAPFDHFENIIDVINGDEYIWTANASQHFGEYWAFHWNSIGTMWNLHKSSQFGGNVLVCDRNGSGHSTQLSMGEAWDVIARGREFPEVFEFTPGAHFMVSKTQIRMNPIEYYKDILTYLETSYESPWTLERLIAYIFH